MATAITVAELMFLSSTIEPASVEKISSRMGHSELQFTSNRVSDSILVPKIKKTDRLEEKQIALVYGRITGTVYDILIFPEEGSVYGGPSQWIYLLFFLAAINLRFYWESEEITGLQIILRSFLLFQLFEDYNISFVLTQW